ncbi:RagB/SusD family nutrient uptake outer membrane protein [Pedobacter cryophilus]|uniref:RagB/SusD family nutrient uptake outer membrane protein n=1 Tax=Pedobacter cryophilus TaxID=2571271 RepID=A0A4U1BX52_9SPHI|nr:RagB/SusD family nutrient uptake outer membrane protein [Pedobacter cryophilus]TKB96911.1 RagB/SusD family nutrient uptake outer membrane protein [Pedobacter cryophilus]
MKTIKQIIFLTAVVFLAASCKKDFLDKAPSVNLPEEKVFSDPILAVQYADNAYNFLVNDYARFNTHRGITGQAADEAVTGNNEGSINTLTQGTYHAHSDNFGTNDISYVYARSYAGIRIANVMLSKIDGVNWPAINSPRDRVEGEMHFVRALLYFELIKRFGGVVLIDQRLEANGENDFPRNSYQECVDFILKDLDAADALLPLNYNATLAINNGRATVGASKALRSRLLLYAASKLNNETNDLNKWKLAADAAKAVMDLNEYSLQSTYEDILNVPTSTEYIMTKVRGPRAPDGMMLDFVMSPGSGGAQGQLNPTQNHVDLYDMLTTGRPITDPLSGYDATKPYVDRDPRLKANVLYNDVQWQGVGVKIETWSQTSSTGVKTFGKDYRENNPNYTATRYYCRKLWPEPYVRSLPNNRALLNYIYFRYAEILLNYAEAQNEFSGPDASILNALNLIRTRAGMPVFQTTNASGAGYIANNKDDFRIRIRNERAVELAFEDARWYDIQRWKVGPEIVAKPMYGMDVVKNTNGSFTYTKVLLPIAMQKVFLDYMHRYPIPRNEVFKSKGKLIQNTGWE